MYKLINKIIHGDALEVLKELTDKKVDMCITSPPYWNLRDYGVENQLGLEKTFDEYIDKLCNIFDEVKRVLKDEGSCWVNIGDCYSNSGKGGDSERMYAKRHKEFGKISDIRRHGKPTRVKGLPPKCLCLIPQRFAIEMVNRGWILRNVIIWHKKNCIPASVKDRFTVDFEYLYFFVKQSKYYFEQQFEDFKNSTFNRLNQKTFHNQTGGKKDYAHGVNPNRSARKTIENMKKNIDDLEGRNKRTVWNIATKPFSEAHFAVFPEELIETPIRAGCPEGGIVLDPFMGAGTTALVALRLDRKFIGIELNKKYIEIANKRIQHILDQGNLFDTVNTSEITLP